METLYRGDALSAGMEIAERHAMAVTCCDSRNSQRNPRIQVISAIEGVSGNRGKSCQWALIDAQLRGKRRSVSTGTQLWKTGLISELLCERLVSSLST